MSLVLCVAWKCCWPGHIMQPVGWPWKGERGGERAEPGWAGLGSSRQRVLPFGQKMEGEDRSVSGGAGGGWACSDAPSLSLPLPRQIHLSVRTQEPLTDG